MSHPLLIDSAVVGFLLFVLFVWMVIEAWLNGRK